MKLKPEQDAIHADKDDTILSRLHTFIYGHMTEYGKRPEAILLGPQDHLALELALSRRQFTRYSSSPLDKIDMFEGIPIFWGPITQIMAISTTRDDIYIMQNELRKKYGNLN